MSRLRKDGSPATDKKTADALSRNHRSFAAEVERVMVDSISPLPPLGGFKTGAGMAKRLGEHWAAEYVRLLNNLEELAERHYTFARKHDNAAAGVTKGRPPKGALTFESRTGMLSTAARKRRGRGRPTDRGPAFDADVYRSVEEKLSEFKAANQPPEIKAAVECVLSDVALASNQAPEAVINVHYTSFLAAYKRGRKSHSKVGQ
jgi:hypothetical protein